MSRSLIALALLFVARTASAQTLPLVTPGPPPSTDGYLEVKLLEPVVGVYATVINQAQSHLIVDDKFWMPRVTSIIPSQYLGAVQLIYPNNDAILLRFQPEIDADLASVEVAIGARVGNFRPVTHTGANGYSRTYDANAIPEPTSFAIMAAGLLLLRRPQRSSCQRASRPTTLPAGRED